MSRKLDPRVMVRDHWSTLRDYRSDAVSPLDWFVFAGVPGALAGWSFLADVSVGDFSSLLTAVSVLAGLLLAVLVLLVQMAFSPQDGQSDRDIERRHSLLGEFAANVAYGTLVAILTTAFLIGATILGTPTTALSPPSTSAVVLSSILIFLLAHLFLTLLMVIRRFYLLVREHLRSDHRATTRS